MDDSPVGKKIPLDNLFAAFRATNAQKSYPGRGVGCGRNLDSSPIEQTIGWQRVLKGRYPQFKHRETVMQPLSLVAFLVGEAHISGGRVATTQLPGTWRRGIPLRSRVLGEKGLARSCKSFVRKFSGRGGGPVFPRRERERAVGNREGFTYPLSCFRKHSLRRDPFGRVLQIC